ncbi:choice-of-anchor D domain-containing protein, partial [Desulfococcaceae bacterium HSG7]|nr:choice-of-anchor D domain-containing protein [Desulfococcaceae bacterium HSG7]
LAYVFVKPAGGWSDMTQTAKLTASDANSDDHFGWSVAVNGDTAVVGANGDDTGSAYVFVKPAGGWSDMTQTAKLTASDAAADDQFGSSAAVSGDTVVVGAPYNDDDGAESGSAYIFEFSPQPEINLKQGATNIANGGSYNFGSKGVNTNTDMVFTIENTGEVNLTVSTALTVSGADSDEFSIQAQPTSPVTAGGSVTFTVRFSPSSVGAKSATISITNDDSDENPYVLNIQGTGPVPEINLKQSTTDITNGGSHDFGSKVAGSDTDAVFTVENIGSADLTLITPLAIGGTEPGEFNIVTQPAATVAPSDNTTFTVRFSPASAGAKAATISIANNDSDENPYVLNLKGTDTASASGTPSTPSEPPSTPGVLNVTSTSSFGIHTVGSVITITFSFDYLVWVKGIPSLALNTGGPVPGYAWYSGGSGTKIITFEYTLVAGDNITKLDYWSPWALELNGGEMYSDQGVDVNLILPVPGEEGSLGYNNTTGTLNTVYSVYRFYSPGLKKHFFTTDENEKEYLLANAADVWQLENAPYSVFLPRQYDAATQAQKDTLIAVHRFYSAALQTHLYTADANEAAYLIAEAADAWQSEGPVFYVPVGNPEGAIPVYRFYSESLKVHLFTADENEKNHLKDTAGDVWRFEGVAYYAYP